MKILLLNQYYLPDVAPTGQVLSELATALVRRGHDVRVLCSTRSYDGGDRYPYRDRRNGVAIHRVTAFGFGRKHHVGRILDYMSFTFGMMFNVLFGRQRPDIIVSLTTPPYIGAFSKIAACVRGCRHAHWIMDVYPDVMVAHGMVNADSLLHRWSASLTRFTLRGSAMTLGLGPGMARRIERHCAQTNADNTSGNGSAVEWVPLWGDAVLTGDSDGGRQLRKSRGWQDNDLVIMYSGNMGLGHIFDDIFEAARCTADDTHVRWVFAGGGRRRAEVEAFARENDHANIELLPYAPVDSLRAHLCSADVHLVTLHPAWQDCMVPSKLFGVFTVGRPVIFVGADDNSLAHWIREAKAGWVISPGDTEAILRAVEEARELDVRNRYAENAKAYARQHFDRETNSAKICERIESIGIVHAV